MSSLPSGAVLNDHIVLVDVFSRALPGGHSTARVVEIIILYVCSTAW